MGGNDVFRGGREESASGQHEAEDGSSLSARLSADDGGEWIGLDALACGSEYRHGTAFASAELRELFRTIAKIAPHAATVLIHGESGSGKELAARALHQFAGGDRPFVILNCANLVGALAESLLFGHVRGAFTDAREDSPGLFRAAAGGTLFLDEIGELSIDLQPKLLRAVETGEIQSVGSVQSERMQVRLIAATNRDLRKMVQEGSFRADLYFRLGAISVRMPPLRQRIDDLNALIVHFVRQYNAEFGKQITQVSRRGLEALRAYSWPGNVRELSNAIQSAVMLTDDARIDFAPVGENLPPVLPPDQESEATELSFIDRRSYSLESAVHEATRKAIERALLHCDGDCRRAAEILGVSRYTVYRAMSRLGFGKRRRRRRRKATPADGSGQTAESSTAT
jgi:DNA-binding NtrC family response regulator